MDAALYRIVDEPRPAALSRLAVNPLWPFFACMFAGPWLGWSWFAFNGFAFGDERRWRVLAWAFGGAALTVVVHYLCLRLGVERELSRRTLRYFMLLPVLVRMTMSYVLFVEQQRGFELYRYFGGAVKPGWMVVMAGFWLAPRLVEALPTHSLLTFLSPLFQ